MFTKIKQKLFANKKFIFNILLLVWVYFLMSDFSFAAWEPTTPATTSNDTTSKLITVVQWWLSIMSLLLGLMTYLVSLFLSPEWTSGNIFWMSTKLKELWILTSNIVYFAFAFILVFIAFANIFWYWGNKYELKQALPKFIVWILIVPFSWFIVQFFVWISSILTIAAMNLPFDSFSEYKNSISSVNIPSKCVLDFTNLKTTWDATNGTSQKIYDCPKENYKPLGEVLKTDKASDWIFWVMSLYIYWVLDNWNFDKLSLTEVKDLTWVTVQVLFDILFVVAYGLLMIALWLALMMRWIWLWIYMMLSPLFWLLHFLWKDWIKADFFKKFNVWEFISLAMVPVYTMLALSLWLVFIHTVWKWLVWNNPTITTVTVTEAEKPWEATLKINDFSLTVKWPVASSEKASEFYQSFWNTKDAILGTVWALILKILWIVVLWWAVMAALNSSTITAEIISPIAGFWKNIWKLATSLPQHIPIVPWVWNLKWIETFSWTLANNIFSQGIKETQENLWKMFGMNNNELWSALVWLRKTLDNLKNNQNLDNKTSALNELIELLKKDNTYLQNKDFREMFAETLKISWVSNVKESDLMNINGVASQLYKISDYNLKNNIGTYWKSEIDLVNMIRSTWTAPIPSNPQPSTPPSTPTPNSSPLQIQASKDITLKISWLNSGNDFGINKGQNIAETIRNSLQTTNTQVNNAELRTALTSAWLRNDDINAIINQLWNLVK